MDDLLDSQCNCIIAAAATVVAAYGVYKLWKYWTFQDEYFERICHMAKPVSMISKAKKLRTHQDIIHVLYVSDLIACIFSTNL